MPYRSAAHIGSAPVRTACLWALALVLAALPWAATPCAAASARPGVGAQLELAITFDDLPAHGPLPPGETRVEIAGRIIAALRAAGVPPTYGFVNGVQEVKEPASAPVLAAWRAPGFPLGNHTWSHMNLNSNSAEAFEADVLRGEAVLRRQMGDGDWRWLRYPYLSEGDTPDKRRAVRTFLASHGYRIAGVTMSFGDYAFNAPYARCVARHDQQAIELLETAYLQAADDEVTRTRAMAKTLYGHDIPYVLLMHIGALDSRMLPQLLDLYRRRGFRLITLEQAERHPFYTVDRDPGAPAAPDSLEGVMTSRGLPLPRPAFDLASLDQVCAP